MFKRRQFDSQTAFVCALFLSSSFTSFLALTACSQSNSSMASAQESQPGGSPGVSASGNSGAAGNSASQPADPDTVVSSPVQTEQHEWTQEEMLLARPMPMSMEERNFAFAHKAPESIRTWTLGEFHDYTKLPQGRQQLLIEGRRWFGICAMLKKQVSRGQEFIATGKATKANAKNSTKNSAVKNGGVGPAAESEPLPEYLSDEGVFDAGESATTFDHLKELRQDITDLCRTMDDLKKQALRRGRLKAFEQCISEE